MNRRSFLKNSGMVAGAALPIALGVPALASGIASSSSVRAITRSRRGAPRIEAGLEPYTGAVTKEIILHLLRRTGFAPRYGEVSALTGGILTSIVEGLLTERPAPAEPGSWVGDKPDYTSTAQTTNRANMATFRNWWMKLCYGASATDTTAPNPLVERMVLFWSNHWVSEGAKVSIPQFLYWQNVLNRQYALGNFKDYAKAMTEDNAMVWYLDSYLSTKAKPNENFARELMELFTIGPFDTTNLRTPTADPVPNYSEVDIQQAARALTGWTMNLNAMTQYTQATFMANRFDTGADKAFLGQTGNWTHTDIVDIIFQQTDQPTQKNKVALFICTKLYAEFVYPDPGDPRSMSQPEYMRYCNPTNPIIQGMADTFVATNFSIRAVLKQLFISQHFFDTNTVGALIKDPVQFVLASTRSLEIVSAPEKDLMNTASALSGQGYSQFDQPPNVKGFPGYRTWISTTSLPTRNQYSDAIVPPNGGSPHYPIDTIALAKLVCDNDVTKYDDVTKLINALGSFLFPFAIASDQMTVLKDALLQGAQESEWSVSYPNANKMIQNLLSVMLRFAEFQLA
jgi:uncharacterized protein (DUF1800 family)